MIDKAMLKEMREEIDEALKALGEKHGVELHAGNASFTADGGHFKLEISTITDSGQTMDRYAQEFLRYSYKHRVPKEALFCKLGSTGEILRGFLVRARTVPFVIEYPDGTLHRVSENAVLTTLPDEYKTERNSLEKAHDKAAGGEINDMLEEKARKDVIDA